MANRATKPWTGDGVLILHTPSMALTCYFTRPSKPTVKRSRSCYRGLTALPPLKESCVTKPAPPHKSEETAAEALIQGTRTPSAMKALILAPRGAPTAGADDEPKSKPKPTLKHRLRSILNPKSRSRQHQSDAPPTAPAQPSHEEDADRLTRCQQAYWASTTPRRPFRRSHLARRTSTDDPIFAEHALALRQAPPSGTGSGARIHLSKGPRWEDVARFEAPRPDIRGFARSVECFGTANPPAKHVELRRERTALLGAINALRAGEQARPVVEDEGLSGELQGHAEAMVDLLAVEEARALRSVRAEAVVTTTITVTEGWGGRYCIRLISPPELGAGRMCGEYWRQGKWARHTAANPAPAPTSMVDGDRVESLAVCPCRERQVFEILISPTWRVIGLGRTRDGRWVVELAGDGEEEKALPAVPGEEGNGMSGVDEGDELDEQERERVVPAPLRLSSKRNSLRVV